MTLKTFAIRWQEYLSWTPLLVALSIFGWILFGALDPRTSADTLNFLLELPMRTAYAAAALGITFLARRRQRHKLSPEQQAELWTKILAGERGALIVYLTDTLIWVLSFALAMLFFWPAR